MNVTVIGAGLAGCEAAWQLAQRGVGVTLREMKPEKMTPAHVSPDFAELVCSNSLRGAGLENAVGLLKEELRRLGSIILEAADATRVEAGGALAVDRRGFSQYVTRAIRSHPLIQVVEGEATDLPGEGEVIVATGPLTSDALAEKLAALFGQGTTLNFFDAAAPLVTFESIDMGQAWFASGTTRAAPTTSTAPWMRRPTGPSGRNCARPGGGGPRLRGQTCLRGVYARGGHGPPGGGHPALRAPEAPGPEGPQNRPGALRRGAAAKGQRRGDHLQPGGIPDPLEVRGAEAGVLHDPGPQERGVRPLRGDAPEHLSGLPPAPGPVLPAEKGAAHLLCRADDRRGGVRESTASGFLVGVETARRLRGMAPIDFPPETAIGALGLYISNESVGNFQPMNINFGIIPPLGYKVKGKRNKNTVLSQRSLEILEPLRHEILR